MRKNFSRTTLFGVLIFTVPRFFSACPVRPAGDNALKNSCPPKALTIHQAVMIAYCNYPGLEAIAHSIHAYERLEQESMSGYLPQVELFTFLGTTNRPLWTPARFTDVHVSQLIYSAAGPLQQRDLAEKDTYIERMNKKKTALSVRFNAETAFLNVWLAYRKKKLIDTLDSASKLIYERDAKKRKIGLWSIVDWQRVTADYEKSQSVVQTYVDELCVAYDTLRRALGCQAGIFDYGLIDLSWRPDALSQDAKCLGGKIKKPSVSIEEYFTYALKYRPELSIQDTLAEKEILNQKIFQRGYVPELSLVANVDRDSTGINDTFAGLKINWHIFDGFAKMHKAAAAEARRLQAVLEKRNTRDMIALELSKTYYALDQLIKTYDAEKARYYAAKADFAARTVEHKVGLLSPVDFAGAQVQWETARFAWLNYIVTCALKERELYFIVGYPDELGLAI